MTNSTRRVLKQKDNSPENESPFRLNRSILQIARSARCTGSTLVLKRSSNIIAYDVKVNEENNPSYIASVSQDILMRVKGKAP